MVPRASLLLVTVLAAGGTLASDTPTAAQEARAKAAVAAFQADLKQVLTTALKSGPVPAIEACRGIAPELAKTHSKEGLRMGRTSERLRNPANTPPAWVAPALDELGEAPRGEWEAKSVPLPSGALGYVQPIVVGKMCLTCHGASLSPPVQEALARAYPKDRATGYAEGDLRGAFWVEVAPLPATGAGAAKDAGGR